MAKKMKYRNENGEMAKNQRNIRNGESMAAYRKWRSNVSNKIMKIMAINENGNGMASAAKTEI
jgi:hypothetical protein